ncbi:hypothetical protein CBP31_13135 [Oceanisphaera profunda]|uniref:Uncharacterized protein n=1 Tax=Oceanisphaera profunda TaxID=1416627 RepID=A0A1Y0D7C7_9GAMM|nr:hypothetical protein [Oceanisphaera profunda]ART83451.1 hypothetical protein CBP31_13135 [Oceanisphaera profunda]
MCKQTSYSKYQRSVIKFLTDHLDVDTPFTYERTQTNHLKVLIDGVDKPLFTGSTPSDYRSLTNFSADVKRELKASRVFDALTDKTEPEPPFANYLSVPHEKLIKGCIKSLRSRLDTIKSKEQEKVLESRSLNVIAGYRENVVKRAIELALQVRRSNDYIKTKEKKNFETKVAKYLDFMMPTLAHYSDLLESKSSLKKQMSALNGRGAASDNSIKLPSAASEQRNSSAAEQPTIKRNGQAHGVQSLGLSAAPSTQPEAVFSTAASLSQSRIQQSTHQSSATELMSMSANNRVDLLRNLSKAQSLQLIDDLNQALALNREQDIEAVVTLIKEKGVSLESIIARLDAE